MTSYVALLRGINVGGHAKLSMSDLRTIFDGLGYSDVRTYIQSGNVVFRTPEKPASMAATIEARLVEVLGLAVPVVIRTGTQLASALARNPLADGTRDTGRLHVTFLATAPAAAARTGALDADAHLPDEFRVMGREVYVHCPNGYGRTKLTNAYFERALGVAATTRTVKTVAELARMSS